METREASDLVGRDAELRALGQELHAVAAGGRMRVVEVVGEAGIGKTSLLDALGDRADRDGWLALGGRASEYERETPFGPVVDALDDFVAALAPTRLRRLGPGALGELGSVLPALSGHVDGARRETGSGERFLAHRAVRSLLGELAAARPLMLVLDDLHWADDASVELLAHLLRRPVPAPVLLGLAYRPAAAPGRLAPALDASGVTRIELGPLGRREADALLGARADPAARATIYEESGGNPLFLEQLARHGGPAAAGAPRAPRGVPALVVATVAAELRALGEPVAGVARVAAVAGEPFEPDVVAEVGQTGEGEVLAALDVLLAADLVRPSGSPRCFRFRHPIVRRAVYESAPPGWRLAAHGRADRALAERGAEAGARAHHVERAARRGDERAAAVLADAGRAAAGRAPGVAAHWYEAALELLPERHPRRVELLVARASALGAGGRLAESRDCLRVVLTLLPADQPAARIPITAACAKLEHLLGRHREGRALLLEALAVAGPGAAAHVAELQIQLAANSFFAGAWDEQLTWARRALRTAEATEDRELVAAATVYAGGAEYMADRVDEARGSARRAAELVDGLGDERLAHHIDAVGWLGLARALPRGPRRGRAPPRPGPGHRPCGRSGRRHRVRRRRARVAGPVAWPARRGCGASRRRARGGPAGRPRAAAGLGASAPCWAALLAGDLHAAVGHGEQAVALGEGDVVSVLSACLLAEARLEAGDAERCRAELLAVAGGESLALVERGFRAHWYEVLARAELACDRLSAAGRWAERAEAACAGLGIAGREVEARRARAAVELAAGRPEQAAEQALAAMRVAAAAGRPLEAARTQTLAGSALAAAGDRAGAIDLCGGGRGRAHHAGRGPDGRRGRPRAAPARATGAPWRPARRRRAERSRAGARAARCRRPHEPPDRGAALPQREDRRAASLERLSQARGHVAGGGRRPGGRRAARRLSPAGDLLSPGPALPSRRTPRPAGCPWSPGAPPSP